MNQIVYNLVKFYYYFENSLLLHSTANCICIKGVNNELLEPFHFSVWITTKIKYRKLAGSAGLLGKDVMQECANILPQVEIIHV